MSANSRQISALMESLATGRDPLATELTLFSDLDREDAEEVRGAWPRVPAAIRERMLRLGTELAEDNVDLDFAQLARIALHDPEASVRRAAIACVWESEDRHVAAALASLVREDEDEGVRAEAAAALARFVLRCEFEAFDRTEGDRIVEILREAASDAAESVNVRASAIEALGARSLPWVDTLITDAYYEDDRRLHRAAIHAMGLSAQEKWLEYLADEAESDNPEFRYEAAVALGEIASEDGVETLAGLLQDQDTEVQLAAVVSLGEIGGEEALRLLREFAEEAPPALQEVVESAIGAARFLMDDEDDDGGVFPSP